MFCVKLGGIMKIGYARVSTTDQNLDIQIQTLKEAGCEILFQEKISGGKRDRPQLEKLLEQIRYTDTLVVCKLDRLARSTSHLLEIIEILRLKKAAFLSLSEPWADTTSHAGKMIMTVFSGIAEFERDLIRERTGSGREAAKKRGVRFGRPSKLTPQQKALALELMQNNRSVSEIAKTFGVNRSTIYRLDKV
jgi:DNA invertase Pin-like site-specific DNA recombinase